MSQTKPIWYYPLYANCTNTLGLPEDAEIISFQRGEEGGIELGVVTEMHGVLNFQKKFVQFVLREKWDAPDDFELVFDTPVEVNGREYFLYKREP